MRCIMRLRPQMFRAWRFDLVSTGSNRFVILAGPVAIKIARSAHGRKACLLERKIWAQYGGKPGNGDLLCPILWSDRQGRYVIMRIAGPVPTQRIPEWLIARDKWEYWPVQGDQPDPSEGDLSNWGVVNDRIVMIDYGNAKPE